MSEFREMIYQSVQGQKPSWKNILTRGVIDLLSKAKQDPLKLQQEYRLGYTELRTQLEQAMSGRKRDDFTRLFDIKDSTPEIDRHRMVELERQLYKAKAMTLSIMEKLGFDTEIEQYLQDPSKLKTQFTMEANGPTVRSSFSDGDNQYEVGFIFWKRKENESSREMGYIYMTGANDNTVTELTIDKDTFETVYLTIGQGKKYPKPNNGSMGKHIQLSQGGNIFVNNSHDWLNRQGDNTYNRDGVPLTIRGVKQYSGDKWPAGSEPGEITTALKTIEASSVSAIIKGIQSTPVDWGEDTWLTESLLPSMPSGVSSFISGKNIQ